jgi:hypothetical protein
MAIDYLISKLVQTYSFQRGNKQRGLGYGREDGGNKRVGLDRQLPISQGFTVHAEKDGDDEGHADKADQHGSEFPPPPQLFDAIYCCSSLWLQRRFFEERR